MSEYNPLDSSRNEFPLPHIIPDIQQWPINLLSEDKDAFLEEVIALTKRELLKKIKSPQEMYNFWRQYCIKSA